MKCEKCGGLVVLVDDDELRCVACSKRVYKQEETVTTETRARCTKGACQEFAAEDSVQCPKHRDATRASNVKFNGRAVGQPKRTYTKRAVTSVAVVQPPTIGAKPVRRMDLNGNVLTVLDALIAQREAEILTLRGAKEIMERAT